MQPWQAPTASPLQARTSGSPGSAFTRLADAAPILHSTCLASRKAQMEKSGSCAEAMQEQRLLKMIRKLDSRQCKQLEQILELTLRHHGPIGVLAGV